jgi:hypothetical protein
MDVKYVTKGQPGRTCADCGYFKEQGEGMGDCFGHAVLAAGSCNLFASATEKKTASGAMSASMIQDIVAGQLQAMGQLIEQFAGQAVREQVMLDGDKKLSNSSAVEGALGCKAAIDRLDALTDRSTREKIMTTCGRQCQSHYDGHAAKLKELRQQSADEAEFLANLPPLDASISFELRGHDLIQYHLPGQAGHGLRCSCPLMAALPAGTTASPTFCQCSRAFVEKRWEEVLGRPLQVEVGETAITGSDRCRFIIHL